MAKGEKIGVNKKEERDQFLSSGMKATEDFWKAAVKMWQMPFSLCQPHVNMEEKDMSGLHHDFWTSPTVMIDLFQPVWEEVIKLHGQWTEAVSRSATLTDAADVDQTIQRVSKALLETYGEELGKWLNLPQLGLTRFYQERANIALEKFSKFQTAINEFVMILLKPAGKALQEMQDEVRRLSEQGEDILQDTKKYYQVWIKKMEDQYLQLLRSQEYTESLRKTLTALKDYRVAREQWMMDMLQDVPVPTRKDMDDLYRELYSLKKKIRNLEKGGER